MATPDSAAALHPTSAGHPPAPSELALEALPWGVLLLTANGTVTYLNAAAAALWGVSVQAVLGQQAAKVEPAVLPPAVVQALSQAATDPADYWLPHTQQWIGLRTAPAPAGQRWVFWDNVTARKQVELALRLQREQLQRTIDSSLDLVQVFEAVRDEQGEVIDFTWVLNNAAAERVYGDVIGQRLCQLNPGVVKEGIFDTFKQVVETGVPDQSERHYVHEQFDGWFLQSSVKSGDGVTTTTHDITNRKKAEQELRQSQHLLQSVFDVSLNPIAYHKAVRDAAGRIVDFEFELENRPARHYMAASRTGRRYSEAYPGILDSEVFRLYCAVVETGRPLDTEVPLRLQGTDRWFHLQAVKLDDGLVATAVDVTERRQAQAELLRLQQELAQQATTNYQALLAATTQGFCRLQLLFDEAGQHAVDFRYLELNPAFAAHSGLTTEALGKTVSELVPNLEPRWLETYGRVARTGQAEQLEYHVAQLGRWYDAHAFRVGPPDARQVGVLFSDITERKRREANLAFMAGLMSDFAPLSTVEQVMELAGRRLTQHLQLSHCFFVAVDPEARECTVLHHSRPAGLPAMTGTYPLATFHTEEDNQRLAAGQPMIVSDVDDGHRPAAQAAAYRAIGVRALVNTPYVAEGRWLFDLGVCRSEPGAWAPDDIGLLQEVAARVWLRLERAGAEEALRVSEEKYRTLFDTMAEGFALCALERDAAGQVVDVRYLELNRALQAQTGLDRQAMRGQPLSAVLPPADLARWLPRYAAISASGEPARFEEYAAGLARWFAVSVYPRPGEELAVFFRDITERKERERQQAFLLQFSDELRALGDAQMMEETGVRLLAEYLQLDRAYVFVLYPAEDRALVRSEQRAAHLASLGGEVRMSDFPETVVRIADETLVVHDTESDARFSALNRTSLHAVNLRAFVCASVRKGPKTVVWSLAAVSATPRTWTQAEVELIETVAERLWAAVEKAKAEAALRESKVKFASLFAASPAPFVILRPDAPRFTIVEVNDAYLRATMRTREELVGQGMLEAFPDNPADPDIAGVSTLRASLERVLATRQTDTLLDLQYDIARPDGTFEQRWWSPVNAPVLNERGEVVAIIHHVNDVTERHRAQQAVQGSEARLRGVLDGMGEGFGLLAPDFTILEHNREALRLDGRARGEIIGRLHWDVYPESESSELGHLLKQAMRQREPVSLEHQYAWEEGRARWLEMRAYPMDDGSLAVFWRDVTERRRTEAALRETEARHLAELEQQVARRTRELRESRDLLQTVFDTNLIAMSVLEAVRDEAGAIRDFRLRLVSKELERETGRSDLAGKLYAQEYPGIRSVGIFDLIVQTIETGQPQGMEYFYPHEGFDKWFACQFVKLGDGVVATNLDITERKTAEQERLKNLRLLEQAEAVAGLGSWDYDLATGTMRWSDGMYHLFGKPPGQPVGTDIYLTYAVDEDRARAEQLVARLTAGSGDVEETLRLRLGAAGKTIRVKAVVLPDETGRPARVLGVDLDITELQRLEADNLRLRLTRQQALFEAVQAAQETERGRIAESLHNGVGQTLYATKLQLDQVPAAPALQRTAELLAEAIRQTRAISHELVPLALNEFGLDTALQDICRKLGSRTLRFDCHVDLSELTHPLPQPLQIALYRIAQELAQNVVKHAQASEASLTLEAVPGFVLLRVEDNGVGFPAQTTAEAGMGLRSIRDRVALLGGHMEAGSATQVGTFVRLRLPIT
ncbi:PAS domain-containing protein [Hymenobacter latericus]|uniref:PAS domain-containing protein n=1 Tax=Hymenobacter sp. YIM 151858-1 TaxID=2987688 RepID=UPI00222734BD|nr:PAS domain-containing protein [Hymenobacter sp. YIM 151858-1]UYZ61241.1 PAS domain-containing protein [Hymenobacter sp. YIM 151858-1]